MDIHKENELPEEKKESHNEKKEDIITEETFENINSPQLIQNILHLITNSSKIGLDLESNIIKSLISINDLMTPLLLDNKDEENDIAINSNFNPFLHALNKKNELCKLNFEELNIKNKFLNQKIKQYNELKQKISDFKNDKNNENKELNKKEKMHQKLFLVQHPLISIFEEEINIKEIKKELHKEYLNKMENHTEYKYTEPRNLLGNINLHNFLHFNDEEENQEIDDQNDDEEDSNNENEDDEGSFVDEVYNGEMEEMEEIGNDNNNNNIGVVEVPIQVENIPQQNANINIENAGLPNQVENIQQQNDNIQIDNVQLPIQVEIIQQQNENMHIENAELLNQQGNFEQSNENNILINNNNNEDNNQNNTNEEP